MTKLTTAQIESFRRDGFLAPVALASAAEARRWRDDLEAFERTLPESKDGRPIPARDRRRLHAREPWARTLVEDPRLLDVMEQILGPDILVFTSTFFIKEPGTDAITAWHQDATFFGLSPHEHVTAWVAFSDATVEAGCMEFVPGSHKLGQLKHGEQIIPGSINAGSQALERPIDTTGKVYAPIRAGEFSLHHTLIAHNSPPNASADRRIGYGISYIPAHCKHSGTQRHPATLVRGTDRYGHFELERDPRVLSPAERIEQHHRTYGLYRACYEEQMARHHAVAA